MKPWQKQLFLTAFAAGLSAIAGNSVAAECEGQADRAAFATASPVELALAGSVGETKPYDVQFGLPYPLLDESPDLMRLCIDGKVRLSRPGQFVAGTGSWLKIDERIYRLQRPSVAFWLDRNSLVSLLNDRDGSTPDYREVVRPEAAGEYRFPIVDQTSVEVSSVVRKQVVETVRVLVPFSREAIDAYGDIQQWRERYPAPVFLLDGSGSASLFLNDLLGRLGREMETSERLSSRIRKVGFDGMDPLAAVSSTLFDLIRDGANSGVGNSGKPGVERIGEALNRRLREIPAPTGNAPLFALAGGDVDMTGIDPSLIGHVYAFQVTPELDGELERSVLSLGEGRGSFFPFSAGQPDELVSLIDELRNFAPSAGDGTDQYATVVESQIRSSFMPVLPTAADNISDLLPSGPVSGNQRWVALELWVVVNRQMLDVVR